MEREKRMEGRGPEREREKEKEREREKFKVTSLERRGQLARGCQRGGMWHRCDAA